MPNKNLKNKIYINLLLVLFSFAIFYFLVLPIYSGAGNNNLLNILGITKSLKTLLQEKSNYQAALLKMENNLKSIETINKSYETLSQDEKIANFTNMIPAKVDPVEVINELSAIPFKHNMRLTSPRFTDDNKNTQNNYNTLTIDFSTSGTYQQLKSFLRDIENSKRIFNIKNISFASSPDAKVTSKMSYQISLETYYLK